MASAVAAEKWQGMTILEILTDPDSRGYEQFGAMKGEVFIYDRTRTRMEGIPLNLPGVKVRRWGPTPVTILSGIVWIVGVCSDGLVFLLGVFSARDNGLKQFSSK